MNNTNQPENYVSISRDCIQQLLHEALLAGDEPCSGLLTGSGNMIESHLPVTKIVDLTTQNDTPLLGIYLKPASETGDDTADISQTLEIIQTQSGHKCCCFMLLKTSHAGRIDVVLYADIQLSIPLTLTMLENDDLYPAGSKG